MYLITTTSNPTAALKTGEFIISKSLPNLPQGLRKLLKTEIPRWNTYNLEELYVAYPTLYGNANTAYADGCICVVHEEDYHVVNDLQHATVSVEVEPLCNLTLIANLGINIPVVEDEDELKTHVLIEAAKIGARKLGEKL